MGGVDMRNITSLLVSFIFCASAAATNISVTYTINTEIGRTPISPYIYGSNWGSGTDYTIRRSGGNRLTTYNWENNFSNAGNDWYYSNDNLLSSSMTPGKAITDFHDLSVSQGQASILTLQMADYVSADANGNINLTTETAPSSRFKKVVFVKGNPFCSPTDNPDGNDPNVYMDEFVNFLVSKYGYAGDPNGVKFYCLDNEPDLWSNTHPEVHPNDVNCAEYKDKSVELSIAVKNIDPNTRMLGPVSYGFTGYYSFQDAPDWSSVKGSYAWFLDYYLDKMEANSVVAGKRLLDALDIHWYPEAQDGAGNRITNTVNTTAMYNARMQAPRTLWDTSYVWPNGETSWINQWFSSYLPLIPKLKNSIDTYYPDTNLAITEYAYGNEDHWSCGIATTDVLGIFGKYGVYIASYWGDGTYIDAAIKLYRNYDGDKSTFGDIEVHSTISNKVDSSIYASVLDGNTSQLHLIVINKNINSAITGTFNITSPQNFVSGRAWHFNDSSPSITETTPISVITNNSFSYTIPATTVCHIVLQAGPQPPLTITKCKVTAGKTQYRGDGDYNDMKDTFEASGTASFPDDLSDINHIDVNITSPADDEVIYHETIDFNASTDVSKGKYKHSYKIPKGRAGAITSLLIDFNKGTFSIKAKNIDLTGLACPLRLGFSMGSYEPNGQADETIVNGSKKIIPTRLMRLYKDTLIVTKAKVKDSSKPSSDSLSITGDIAVADMNLDTGEPNLAAEDVVITLCDLNSVPLQTFTILQDSFKTSGKRHLYKCSKINPVIAPVVDVNTLITASIDLDKCVFTISITKTDLSIASGNAKLGLSFAAFDETDDLTF
jgi:hypothetical protein